jgi:hypothetical protein
MKQGGNPQTLDLFCQEPVFPLADYSGPEYVRERDRPRLLSQSERIFNLMRDGLWRTLPEIAKLTGDPPASISAQLRHLRKPKFGSHAVERRSRRGALFEYRLIVQQKGPVGEVHPGLSCNVGERCVSAAEQIVARVRSGFKVATGIRGPDV